MPIEILAGGTAVCVSNEITFGQDALLLANFCAVHPSATVCDLGTGCGIIPLHWYDRGHRGVCFAIEIQEKGITLLQQAIKLGNILNIRAIHADLRELQLQQHCDVVACNPPFFQQKTVNKNESKAIARHEISCTFSDICKTTTAILKNGGKFCLCHRPERLADVMQTMRDYHIEPKRLQFVSAHPNKEPKLFLLEGQKNRAAGLRVLPMFITQNNDGSPSQELLAIYQKETIV